MYFVEFSYLLKKLSPHQALGEMLVLIGAVVATTATFHKVNPTAGNLLLPYIAWLSFAALLNFKIWRLNKDRTD